VPGGVANFMFATADWQMITPCLHYPPRSREKYVIWMPITVGAPHDLQNPIDINNDHDQHCAFFIQPRDGFSEPPMDPLPEKARPILKMGRQFGQLEWQQTLHTWHLCWVDEEKFLSDDVAIDGSNSYFDPSYVIRCDIGKNLSRLDRPHFPSPNYKLKVSSTIAGRDEIQKDNSSAINNFNSEVCDLVLTCVAQSPDTIPSTASADSTNGRVYKPPKSKRNMIRGDAKAAVKATTDPHQDIQQHPHQHGHWLLVRSDYAHAKFFTSNCPTIFNHNQASSVDQHADTVQSQVYDYTEPTTASTTRIGGDNIFVTKLPAAMPSTASANVGTYKPPISNPSWRRGDAEAAITAATEPSHGSKHYEDERKLLLQYRRSAEKLTDHSGLEKRRYTTVFHSSRNIVIFQDNFIGRTTTLRLSPKGAHGRVHHAGLSGNKNQILETNSTNSSCRGAARSNSKLGDVDDDDNDDVDDRLMDTLPDVLTSAIEEMTLYARTLRLDKGAHLVLPLASLEAWALLLLLGEGEDGGTADRTSRGRFNRALCDKAVAVSASLDSEYQCQVDRVVGFLVVNHKDFVKLRRLELYDWLEENCSERGDV